MMMAEYIEREAAIREMYKEPSYYDPVNILTEVRDRIKAIPAADVRPVGKWVKNHDDVIWWWECSCCKEKPLISRFGDVEVLSAYCPRCGAKLEIPEGD